MISRSNGDQRAFVRGSSPARRVPPGIAAMHWPAIPLASQFDLCVWNCFLMPTKGIANV